MNLDALTELQVYRTIIRYCQKYPFYDLRNHQHHIKAKSIYRQFENDPANLVYLDPLMHAVAHFYLKEHYRKSRDEVAYEKMKDAPRGVLDFVRKKGHVPFDVDVADAVGFFEENALPEMALALTSTDVSPSLIQAKKTFFLLDRYLAVKDAGRELDPSGIEEELRRLV